MESIEILRLNVSWPSVVEEALNVLGKEKEKLVEYIKTNARGGYDKEERETMFDGDCDEVFRFLRPFIPQFQEQGTSFEIIYWALDSNEDVFCKCELDWDYVVEQLEEDEETPLKHLVSQDEIVYPRDWYAEWAEGHEEETAEWRTAHDDEYDFSADGWKDFADTFPKAKEEFMDYLEGL